MRLPQFIFFSVLIFLLELALPPLLAIGFLLFPAFAIFYLLKSQERTLAGVRVLSAGLVFDAFSGLSFGWFSLLLLAVVLSILFAQHWLTINRHSFWSVVFYSLVFLLEFLVLASLVTGERAYLFRQLPVLAGETILLLIFFNLVWPRSKPDRPYGLQ